MWQGDAAATLQMSMGKRLGLRTFGVVLAFATILTCPSVAVAAEGASLLWVREGRLTRQAEQLLAAMRRAEDFGLSSHDFQSSLEAIDSPASGNSPEQLDDLVTAAASQFVREIHSGRVLAGTAGYALTRRRAPLDMPQALRELSRAPSPLAVLEQLEPRSGQYRSLKQVLARYRRLPAGLASLPALPRRRVDVGDVYVGSAQLEELLVVGVLTDRDLVVSVIARDIDARTLKVGDVMTSGPVTVREHDPLEFALAEMRRLGVRRLPVLNDCGTLAGVVSLDDIVPQLVRQLNDVAGSIHTEGLVERESRAAL
jgi:CBS domain-containing protein